MIVCENKKGGIEMAVKVIKYGNKRRTNCEYCESLLEFTKEDIKSVQTGMNDWEWQIVCPVCGEKITIKENITIKELLGGGRK